MNLGTETPSTTKAATIAPSTTKAVTKPPPKPVTKPTNSMDLITGMLCCYWHHLHVNANQDMSMNNKTKYGLFTYTFS